jgi:hypothetical protein
MLWTVVGDKGARMTFFFRKVQEQVQLLEKVPTLERQEGLLLLRRCTLINLQHLLRTLKTDDIDDAWRELGIADILFLLPTRMGGCGIADILT